MDIANYLTQRGQTAGHRELWRLVRTRFNENSDRAEYAEMRTNVRSDRFDETVQVGLSAAAKIRLVREIDQLLLREEYQFSDLEYPDVGYIFCPEHRSGRPELLYAKGGEDARLWLFGPSLLPDERAAATMSSFEASETKESASGFRREPGSEINATAQEPASNPEQAKVMEASTSEEAAVDVVLGEAIGGGDDIAWRVSIRANPHW